MKSLLRYLLLATVGALIISLFLLRFGVPSDSKAAGVPLRPPTQTTTTTSSADGFTFDYSDLLHSIAAKQVARATINENSHTVSVVLKSGAQTTITYLGDGQALAGQLTASGADVQAKSQSAGGNPFLNLIGALAPFLLLGFILFIVFRVMRSSGAGGGMGMGMPRVGGIRKSARVERTTGVAFRDVAGCDEAIYELREVVEFLKDPTRFQKLGARMPRGVLLSGEPGTGKTLMAKALAGEAGVPFFAVSGSDFVETFVGVGAARVRDLFEQARKEDTGAIVFIDEIDAIGRRRSAHASGGNDEREGTLNQLLVEMDGFDNSTGKPVIVIGATNRLDVLDPALTRPGRFDRQVTIPAPTEDGRLAILKVHSTGKPLAPDADLERVAAMTSGLSGAQLAQICNEAAIMAARDRRKQISMEDLYEGWLRALAGPERASHPADDKDRRTIAYHEAGHALTAELCETQSKAQRVTIKARGQALGLAAYGQVDKALHDPKMLHEWMICILGGRAAEHILNGVVSSGAFDDLKKANAIARRAVEEFGFSPRIGQIISANEQGYLHFSEKTRAIVDEEVERLVAEAYSEAVDLLKANWTTLQSIAELLISQETIDRLDIQQAVSGGLDRERMVGPKHLIPSVEPVLSGRVENLPSEERRPRHRALIPLLAETVVSWAAQRRVNGKGRAYPAG